MKYLLLGGAGFIGQHLAQRLLDEGHEVTILDNLATSRKPEFDVNFQLLDIARNPGIVASYAQWADIIYFLAGSVGVQHIDDNPGSTLFNNVGLMSTLIPIFQKVQKKVIFTSSSEVYGNGPYVEDGVLTIGPTNELRWGYASAKLTTEFMIAASNFPYVILRLFNIVGPGQRPDYGMVLPRFIDAAKNHKPLTVYDTGDAVRAFCHIKDGIEFFRRLEPYTGETFNVGTLNHCSITHLAERVIELSGSESEIVYVPIEKQFKTYKSDLSRRIPDIVKLHRYTQYQPEHSLDSIIRDML